MLLGLLALRNSTLLYSLPASSPSYNNSCCSFCFPAPARSSSSCRFLPLFAVMAASLSNLHVAAAAAAAAAALARPMPYAANASSGRRSSLGIFSGGGGALAIPCEFERLRRRLNSGKRASVAGAPGSSLPGAGVQERRLRYRLVQSMASTNGTGAIPGLAIDLRGKRAFVAGVGDDQGYGWAIAKALGAAGAEVLVGTWVPVLNIFETSFRRGKFDESRMFPDGSLFEIAKVYPLDAVYDTLDDVPEDVRTNKRYAGATKWTVQEVAESVKQDFGSIDILVHSLANGPEVTKPLLETSRRGYLAAVSASSYSYVSLLKYFVPLMNPGGCSISLTYIASEKIIPGYGGGMSSAKAALESDTRVLAFEAGRKYNVRVNTISAGPLRSRAAKAIGFIDDMINYSKANAPIQTELNAEDIGNAAAFLASPLASAITGTVLYVDNGLHAMGLAVDSLSLPQATPAASEKTSVLA